MTVERGSVSHDLKAKVSTGYGRLDEALRGGFLAGSAILLSAPASDEVPLLLRDFLMPAQGEGLLIIRSLSAAQAVWHSASDNLKCLICSDKPVPPSRSVFPGKGIENLTDLNLQINEVIGATQPKRLVLDILSDILLRHKALQTRKWLTDLLERLRSKGITTLALLNPYMHSNEDVQAVVDLFDGNLEIIEEKVEGTLRKFLRIKWMHGIEVVEKEFLLIDLAPEPKTPSQQVSVATAQLKEPRWLTPLVSRTEELSKLKATFENALMNRSSVVALQGEAGVGKTRLMQELAVYATSKKALVLSGGASEDGLPYAPWIEITRQYVAQAPGELLRRMLGLNASELAKLVPDIAAKLGTIPPSKALGEQQDKIRFYEAVTQFFIAICNDAPLVLLFDDMQYVDQPSLDLLEYFVRSSSNLRVLSVCSLPAEHELESSNPLEQTLIKLNKQRLLEAVTVKNLDKENTASLIKQIFGEQTVSPEFADLMYQRTGGNPFFVEEVLRSLVEDGTIFRTEKGWDRKPIQDIAIPKSVKGALKSRLAKLDQETVSVLTMAVVIGSEFDFQVLQEVTHAEQDTLLNRIEEALSSGLILEDEHRPGILKFTDSLVRELLFDDLSKLRRTNYHLKIGEAMEKLYSKNIESQAEAIANHFSEGGNTQQGIKYSIMAGDRNGTIHAYQQAINDYRRALDLIGLEDMKGRNDREKAAVLEKLANSFRYAGQLQESIRFFDEALTIYEKLNDSAACARAYLGLAKATRTAKGMGPGSREAAQILERGLKYLKQDLESFDAASIYSKLADNYAIVDEWEEANMWAEKALRVGEKTSNFGAVAEALSMKGSFLTDTGRLDEGLLLWERAFNLSLQHEDYEEAINCVHNLSIYTYPRDFVKAKKLALQELELSKRVNHITQEASALLYLSYLSWLHGDWDEAFAQLAKAFEIKRRLNLTAIFGTWDQGWKGWLSLCKGELEQVEIELQRALATPETKITFIVQNNLVMGLLRLEQGRVEEARDYFEKCVEAFKNWEFTTMPLLHIESLLHLTSIYARNKEPEKAVRISQWTRRLADELKSDAGLAMASQAEAVLLLASGDRKGAEEAYLECLALWEKAGWPYYHAKALVVYSEAIAQRNPEELKKRLEKAAEIFRKLGAKRDLEKTQAKLSALS